MFAGFFIRESSTKYSYNTNILVSHSGVISTFILTPAKSMKCSANKHLSSINFFGIRVIFRKLVQEIKLPRHDPNL